jgi:hypothetical protein
MHTLRRNDITRNDMARLVVSAPCAPSADAKGRVMMRVKKRASVSNLAAPLTRGMFGIVVSLRALSYGLIPVSVIIQASRHAVNLGCGRDFIRTPYHNQQLNSEEAFT